jgi:uncharacterized protein YjbJ (UPF0337 family)/ElaB/YqjD/DUF883 family membrane-anchored ribosome-binding protein
MISSQELQGQWQSIRGKVKEKWGQLTDDDLQIASGNVDQLFGRIQQKTGQTKRQIEDFFNDLMQSTGGVKHAAQDIAEQSRQAMHRVGEEVGEKVRDGYHRAERMVQEYPASSIASVFIGGLVTGVFIGLCMSSRS